MSNAQNRKEDSPRKRKTVLSPELNEFLHMLKSLETELSSETAQAR